MHKVTLSLQVFMQQIMACLKYCPQNRRLSYHGSDRCMCATCEEFVLLPILKIFADFPSFTTRYSQSLMFSVCV